MHPSLQKPTRHWGEEEGVRVSFSVLCKGTQRVPQRGNGNDRARRGQGPPRSVARRPKANKRQHTN